MEPPDAWVREFSDASLESNLSANLELDRRKIGSTLGDLAAELAWRHGLTRLTEIQREHLVSWEKAVDPTAKGTGKYAETHRRAAREHMSYCRPAIPAWIMPISWIAENVGAVASKQETTIERSRLPALGTVRGSGDYFKFLKRNARYRAWRDIWVVEVFEEPEPQAVRVQIVQGGAVE